MSVTLLVLSLTRIEESWHIVKAALLRTRSTHSQKDPFIDDSLRVTARESGLN